ncbi:MAG TPA: hypothetical protein VKA67_11470, partial [Verrucomicrobiae bacterium]|nr:hypothetical protein [Verrucomicrobiae bacterium]
MFGLGKADFDYSIKRTWEALARLDAKTANEFLAKAANTENGMEKIESLAWRRVSDKSYDLVLDHGGLSLLSLFLDIYKPSSCIGWLASAKVALQIHKIDEFEPYAEKAGSLMPGLAEEEIVPVSICLFFLYIEYSNVRYRVRPPDTITEIEEMNRISRRIEKHRRTVLETIEIADQKRSLSLSTWKTY